MNLAITKPNFEAQDFERVKQQLITGLKKKQEDANRLQKEIKRMLLDEIIKRYQYKQGLYEYYTTNNSEIARATALLANQNEYNTILK